MAFVSQHPHFRIIRDAPAHAVAGNRLVQTPIGLSQYLRCVKFSHGRPFYNWLAAQKSAPQIEPHPGRRVSGRSKQAAFDLI